MERMWSINGTFDAIFISNLHLSHFIGLVCKSLVIEVSNDILILNCFPEEAIINHNNIDIKNTLSTDIMFYFLESISNYWCSSVSSPFLTHTGPI